MTATLFKPPPAELRQDLHIACRVYGDIVFKAGPDALLIDLILSPSFQRLRRVLQHGISALVGPLATETPVTRFEHCIGACWLVKNLGASMEEQASALLHDITHLALSHVADSVFGYVVHEVDKDLFYTLYPDIPAIVAAHGFDPKRIFEEEHFSLLERDSPLLCGDRTDYALRDSLSFGLLSPDRARAIWQGLVAFEGEICCRDASIARELSDAYMESDTLAWSNPVQGALYQFTSEAYREAYQANEIDRDSMWSTPDVEFWRRLTDSPLPAVHLAAARVRPSLRATEIAEGEPLGEGIELRMYLKPRVIDPSVVVDGRKIPLSQLDGEYLQRLTAYKASKAGEKRYRVEL